MLFILPQEIKLIYIPNVLLLWGKVLLEGLMYNQCMQNVVDTLILLDKAERLRWSNQRQSNTKPRIIYGLGVGNQLSYHLYKLISNSKTIPAAKNYVKVEILTKCPRLYGKQYRVFQQFPIPPFTEIHWIL
jgi:hypothetical protein